MCKKKERDQKLVTKNWGGIRRKMSKVHFVNFTYDGFSLNIGRCLEIII